MAKGAGQKLGTLYFDLGLNDDQFAKDWAKTKAKYGKEVKMDLGINSSGFVKGTNTANSAQRNLNGSMQFTNKTMMSQRMLGMQLSNQFGTLFSIYAVERFISKLATVTGMFELQHTSMNAILQDKIAGDKIFGQIKSLSVESPFRFKDLISYTKQLAAFSIPTNELYVTMKNLADVSAGLGVDMGRITLAFGQVKAASVLRGQELRQFTEAGIPLVAELAKKFTELEGRTVSAGEVFSKISKRMVSFGMVKDIFDDMTSAGGKFYKMQEVQAATLAGKISNLADAFDIALAKIGGNDGGLLKGGVDMLTNLTYHWEGLVKVVVSSIAIFGAYKAATLMATVFTGGLVSAQLSLGLALAAVQKKMISMGIIANLANPIVAVTIFVVALTSALWIMNSATTAQEQAQTELNKINKKAADIKGELSSKISKLVTIINSETSAVWEQVRAYNELQKIAPSVTGGKTLGEFKAQGSDSQQYAISMFESEQEVADKVKIYKAAMDDLEQYKLHHTTKIPLIGTVDSGELKKKVAIVRLAKEEILAIQQAKIEADFLLLPEKTRRDILEGRQKLLLAEKEKLTQTKDLVFQIKGDGLGGWADLLTPFGIKLASINADLATTGIMIAGIGKDGDPEKTPKSIIEKQIKAYQELLDALSVAEAKNSPLKSKIRDLQELLKAYDIPNLAKEQKSADKDAADGLKARIKLIEEAYAWYIKLIEAQGFTVDNAPSEVKSKAKSEVASAKGGVYKNVNISDSGVASNLTGLLNSSRVIGEATLALNKEIRDKIAESDMQALVDKKIAYQKAYDENKDFLQKLADINDKYKKAIATPGMTDSMKGEALYQKNEATSQLGEEYSKRSEEYQKLMLWITEASMKEIEVKMAQVTAMMIDPMKSGHNDKEQQAVWQQMYEELKKKYEELVAKKADPKDTSFKDFKKTTTALNNIQKAVDDLLGSFGDMDADVKAVLTSISATASGVVKILEGVAEASSKTIGAAEKASIILTVISYAIQIATAIINAFKSASDKRKADLEAERVAQEEAYLGLVKYNQALREQYDLSQAIGESRLDWLTREAGMLQTNISLNEKAYASLLKTSLGTNVGAKFGDTTVEASLASYVDANDYKKFLAGDMAAADRIVERLKTKEAMGQLPEAAKAMLDQILALRQEGKDLTSTLNDFLESEREIFTGTTESTIADSIINGFKEGKRGAADFADTFQQLMQGAVQQSLALLADEGIRSWYEDFAKASQSDGILTPSEQADLKKSWETLLTNLGVTADNLQSLTGVSVTGASTSSSGSLRGNIENIKEDTATKLEGYIAGLAQNSVAGRYQMTMIASALTDDGIMIKSEGLMQEVRENIGAMRANSDLMARVMGRFDSCIVTGNSGLGVRMV